MYRYQAMRVQDHMVLVPDYVNDAINKALDQALSAKPEAASRRDEFYSILLAYFDEHGYVPDFLITKEADHATQD